MKYRVPTIAIIAIVLLISCLKTDPGTVLPGSGQQVLAASLPEQDDSAENSAVDYLLSKGYSRQDIARFKSISRSCHGDAQCLSSKVDAKTLEDIKAARAIGTTSATLYEHTTPQCQTTRTDLAGMKLPRRAICPNVFPHTSPADLERTFSALDELKVKMIRFDFRWLAIEPAKGQFNWAKYDNLVKLARTHGIRILAVPAIAPKWASGTTVGTFPPRRLQDYTDFLDVLVRRYKPGGVLAQQEKWTDGYGVSFWEIWNEPNIPFGWKPKPNPPDYVQMLAESNRVIRRIDPDAVILHAGLSQDGRGGAQAFLEEMYAAGAKDCFDAVNLHSYIGGPGNLRQLMARTLEPVRSVMSKYGNQRKPVWFTELGSSRRSGEGDEGAGLVRESYSTLLSESVQMVFWYSLRDQGSTDSHGLMRKDFSPKSAYQAYRDSVPQ